MSQLHQLMNVCDEREKNLLSAMKLRGKEKEVFDLVFNSIGKELPANGEITKRLAITETHLYKINSVLVRKCYDALVPGGGFHLLEYLGKKNLYVQQHHEIGVQEKQLKAGKQEMEPFYLDCYRLLIDVPFRYYDKKLADAYGKKYLAAKKDRSVSDELFVKMQGLFAEINRNAAQKNHAKEGKKIRTLLAENEKKLERSTHYLARYYLYRSFCSYYSYYEKNIENVLAYLGKAIALKEKIRAFFPIDIGQFLRLQYADALFQDGKTDEAFSAYEKVFAEGVEDKMYGFYYHYEQYILLCIILNKFDKARELLEKIFDPCIARRQDIYATRGALAYVKLGLSRNEHRQALHYINLAREINEKTFYLPFDLQLRVLENICFYEKGEYDFALQLTVRNLKFLNSQKADASLEDYKLLFRVLGAFIKCAEDKKPLPQKFRADYERISNQYRNLYCNLLKKLEK